MLVSETSQLLLSPQGPAAATLTMKVKPVARIVESRKVFMAFSRLCEDGIGGPADVMAVSPSPPWADDLSLAQ